MATARLEGLFSTVVHDSIEPARLESLFSTVVHDSVEPARLQALFSTIVHDSIEPAKLQALFSSVVHEDGLSVNITPPSGVSQGDVVTLSNQSSVTGGTLWSWQSVPPGSSVGNAVQPFPDGSPSLNNSFFMGTNKALYHFNAQDTVSADPLPDNGSGALMSGNLALYHFEGNADDSSGNSRNGTVTGASQVTGYVGSNCYEFNGSSDKIDVAGHSDFLSQSISISVWINPDTTSNGETIVGYGDQGESEASNFFWLLQLANNGNVKLVWEKGSGSDVTVMSTADGQSGLWKAGVWNHLGVTRDGNKRRVRFYWNGMMVCDESYSASDAPTGGTDGTLHIGRLFSSSSTYDGKMDELSIWDKKLSSSEMLEVYNKGKNGTRTAGTSSNAIDAWVHGATQATGKIGANCYSFDGSNDSIKAYHEDLAGTASHTYCFWVKPEATQETNAVLFSTRSYDRGIILRTDYNDDLNYELVIHDLIGGSWVTSINDINLVADTWQHLAIVKSGATVYVYINGVVAEAATDYPAVHGPGPGILEIGGSDAINGISAHWAGDIDEFAYFSSAMSALDVKNLYKIQSTANYAGALKKQYKFTADVAGSYTLRCENFNADLFTSVHADITFSAGALGGVGYSLQGSNLQGMTTSLAIEALLQGIVAKYK